uniref:GATA-type domain-containing protein n=1 Tax=Pyramimonas obovata TaxID=1411642 RepID=A0A7S0RGJ1_9CHLO|mmetsp:Transcript_33400/g.72878  ORF Transcript_33400/g.72878 Transcript_33400/m.72878 type:complete len:264 (+) Transcript_33400:453-1244(+)
MSKVAQPMVAHSGGIHISSNRCSLATGNDVYINFGKGNGAWPTDKLNDDEEFLPGKQKFVQSLMKRNDSFTLEYCNRPTTRHAVDMLSHMAPPEVGYMTMNGKTTPFVSTSDNSSLPSKRPSKLRESSTPQAPLLAHIGAVEKPKQSRKTASAFAPDRETSPKEVSLSTSRENKQVTHGACNHCGETESPQWRKGPAEKPHLCNACGTRYLRTGSLKRSGARRTGQPRHATSPPIEKEHSSSPSAKRARHSGSAKASPRSSSE